MKTAPLVSTIIVSFNTAKLTTQAVKSVLNDYAHSKINGEVIVVDNDSNDDSLHQLRSQFENKIQVSESKMNLGFSGGNNIGIQRSSGQYVFLLNSDAEVSPGSILSLINVFKSHPDQSTAEQAHTDLIDRVGIVSGKLVNPDGSLQKQGGALPSLWTLFLWWALPLPANFFPFPPSWSYHIESERCVESEQSIGWLGGTALMMRREVIDEIGLLDEGIFMYAEDVEYCMRARFHHWDIVYTPSTKITHFGSASSSSFHALVGEVIGLNHVMYKHFPAWKARLSRGILRLGTALRFVLFGIILNNGKKKKAYQEILHGLKTNR